MLITGDPGIGKTALVEAFLAESSSRGAVAMSLSGQPTESRLAFAGLDSLLRDRLEHLDRLPPVRRRAIEAAFGLDSDAAPEPFLIGLAVLDVLAEVTAEQPVVVVVEDAHWLDLESSAVLAFVARRLAASAVLLVVTVRPGYRSSLVDVIDDRLELGPLDDTSSTALLSRRAPQLSRLARQRVLGWSGGNPLALLELPEVVDGGNMELDAAGRGELPTTERLRHAFATRALGLPSSTRALLLAAAINDHSDLGEALAAASVLVGGIVQQADLLPAVQAGLVSTTSGHVRFRHALARAAVRDEASAEQRDAAHRALARTLRGAPERRTCTLLRRVSRRTRGSPSSWRASRHELDGAAASRLHSPRYGARSS